MSECLIGNDKAANLNLLEIQHATLFAIDFGDDKLFVYFESTGIGERYAACEFVGFTCRWSERSASVFARINPGQATAAFADKMDPNQIAKPDRNFEFFGGFRQKNS